MIPIVAKRFNIVVDELVLPRTDSEKSELFCCAKNKSLQSCSHKECSKIGSHQTSFGVVLLFSVKFIHQAVEPKLLCFPGCRNRSPPRHSTPERPIEYRKLQLHKVFFVIVKLSTAIHDYRPMY